MEPPPTDVIEQGRQEALDTVRRDVALQGEPVVDNENPLGLPLDENGRPSKLKIVTIPRDKALERFVRCNNLCRFLANREEYIQAFNQLPQHHQIAMVLIQEDWED